MTTEECEMRRIAFLLMISVCAVTATAQSGVTGSLQQKPQTPQTQRTQIQTPAPTRRSAAKEAQKSGEQKTKQLRAPDVIYLPTPNEVVNVMLKVAKVGKDDVLYDLGSGDGRIVIAAVRDYGIKRGTGIDINPERIAEANANAKVAGVTERVRFVNEDLFEADFSDATIITLYLLPDLNLKLRPKLLQLKPGTRIVSHAFDMGDWKPEQTINVNGRTVYFWTVPARGTDGMAPR
jgi:hypothetical protein